VIANKFRNLSLLGLVVLLAVQLTGLSCLSDVTLTVDSGIRLTQAGPADQITGLPQTADDGCPCHLTFGTVGLIPLSFVSPFTPMPPDSPRTVVSTFLHFLFRPPALV